jgi:hypothetical protein
MVWSQVGLANKPSVDAFIPSTSGCRRPRMCKGQEYYNVQVMRGQRGLEGLRGARGLRGGAWQLNACEAPMCSDYLFQEIQPSTSTCHFTSSFKVKEC